MNRIFLFRKLSTAIVVILAAAISACGVIYDDLEPCRHEYRIRFKYDYNISGGDAFAAQVPCVQAWVFDTGGNLMATASAAGDTLKSPDFFLPIDVEAGVYDVIVWAGLESGGSFSLSTRNFTPRKEDLNIDMLLLRDNDRVSDYYSSSRLTPLFYGSAEDVELTAPEDRHTVQDIDISLVKDTNRLSVTLSQLDGSPIGKGDFSFRVEAANSRLNYLNEITEGPPMTYLPWELVSGVGSAVVPSSGVTLAEIYSVMAELSLARLVEGRTPNLVVTRNADNMEIARIDLIKYLLWLKGAHYADMDNQEFLDRQDDWQMTLFIDSNLSWYTAAGIFINNWAVVPSQIEEL